MRNDKVRPIALCVADLHISAQAPASRPGDWWGAQSRALGQVRKKAGQLNVPVLIAGDIFDRWNPPPSAINFAIEEIPDAIAIPGNHDLPNHSQDEISKSAYWTLVMAHKITDLSHYGMTYAVNDDLSVTGFTCGDVIHPPTDKPMTGLSVALVHAYIWDKKNTYPGAPPEAHYSKWEDKLKGYDFAIFGDNHKWFTRKCGDCVVVNCGALMRRKSDEHDYQPHMHVLYSDKTVEHVPLDLANDEMLKPQEVAEVAEVNLDAYMDAMASVGRVSVDFCEALRNAAGRRGVSPAVRNMILKALEGGR